jgi:hypothetical protein
MQKTKNANNTATAQQQQKQPKQQASNSSTNSTNNSTTTNTTGKNSTNKIKDKPGTLTNYFNPMSMPVEDLTNSQEEMKSPDTNSGSMEEGTDSKHGGDADSDGEPLDGLSGDKKKSRPNPPSPTKGLIWQLSRRIIHDGCSQSFTWTFSNFRFLASGTTS